MGSRSNPCRPILAPLDEQQLQSQGLATQNSADNTRKLHRRRMNRSSDSDNDHIALDVLHSSPNAQSAFATIPTYLISEATLYHVGFTKERAAQLWTHWRTFPSSASDSESESEDEGMGVDFLDYLRRSIDRQNDTNSSNDADWLASMTRYGIRSEVQEAIMDPMFKLLRQSQSCAFWVKDTIEMKFAALQQIQETSEERNRLLQQGMSESRIENRFRLEIERGNARAVAARSAPGHTVLYKGIDEGRVANFVRSWDPRYLNKIRNSFPSDFNPTRSYYYFSTQRFVAQYYASWVMRHGEERGVMPKAVIIQLSIPNSAIESLPDTQKIRAYWPSDEWKELIWHSRTGQTLPRHLRNYYHPTLIMGTVARGSNARYNNKSAWQEITFRDVLRIGPREDQQICSQWAFTDLNGNDFLKSNMSAFSMENYDAEQYREWRNGNGDLVNAWEDSEGE